MKDSSKKSPAAAKERSTARRDGTDTELDALLLWFCALLLVHAVHGYYRGQVILGLGLEKHVARLQVMLPSRSFSEIHAFLLCFLWHGDLAEMFASTSGTWRVLFENRVAPFSRCCFFSSC